MLRLLPKTLFASNETGALRILTEEEWRGIGIAQSLGWEHYEVHGTLSSFFLANRLWRPEHRPLTCARNY